MIVISPEQFQQIIDTGAKVLAEENARTHAEVLAALKRCGFNQARCDTLGAIIAARIRKSHGVTAMVLENQAAITEQCLTMLIEQARADMDETVVYPEDSPQKLVLQEVANVAFTLSSLLKKMAARMRVMMEN